MNLVLSTSLNANSKSRVLALHAHQALQTLGLRTEFVDLREHVLPLCDGGPAYSHPDVKRLTSVIGTADALVVATPVYNYTANAALKNLLELTGVAWKGKAVGLLCAAAGRASHMAMVGVMNSMMLDFRCVMVPRYVYATGDAFSGEGIVDASIAARTVELAETTASLGQWAREQRRAKVA